MKQLCSMLLLVFSITAWAQQPIAYWSQNNNELPNGGFGFTPDAFPQSADVGSGELILSDFDESVQANGAYSFLASFAGSTVNALPGFVSGGSLSIQGGPSGSNNGAAIVLKVSTIGYQELELSWSQRGTSTGFNSRTISWSLDGTNYETFAVDSGSLGSSFQRRSYDFSAIEALNNQSEIYFRITVDGASTTTGNNRFDNMLITGTVTADADRLTVYQRDFASNPFHKGWTQISTTGTESWDWNGAFGNVSFSGFVDGSCRANDSWLISPVLDLDHQFDERLAFDIARGFGGSNPLSIYYSNSYQANGSIDPADWVLLTTISSDDFSSNNVPVRFDDFEQLQSLSGQAHIAFRYAFEEGNCSTWRVAGIELTAERDFEPVNFACHNPVTRIHAIQGAGFQSPMQGASVQVEAIVVGSFQQTTDGGLGGFYLQELDQHHDQNPLTSEGIFVYDNGYGVSVQIGDQVRVAATVTEFFEETQLSNPTTIEVCASHQLGGISPVNLTLPVTDFAEFEAQSGMWVQTTEDYTVSDVFNAVRFGEFTVSNGRLFTPTQLVTPGLAANLLSAQNQRNQIIIDNGKTGVNRQPFITGEDGVSEISATNPVRNGYRLQAGFEGFMSYAFGAYRLRMLNTPEFDTSANERRFEPVSESQGDLRMATFNVENLFNTLAGSGITCGPNQLSCRGAQTASELDRQLQKLTSAIMAMNADIIALTEIENDANDATLSLLTGALNAQQPTDEWAFIATGSLGTDAIKPAFIFRSAQVTPQGDFAVLDSSVDEDFDTSRQRPALAQRFTFAEGQSLTAVALHLRAKSCGNASGANADQADGQGCWNEWRTKSAQALLRWLDTDPTHSGSSDFLILGDFNAYAKEDPLTALEVAGYVNLAVNSNNNDYSVYSYTFRGEAGSLDHAFASASLATNVVAAQSWAINADELPAFNYQERPLPGGLVKPASFYQPDAFRSSDHDPLLIDFRVVTVEPPFHALLELIRVNRARSGSTLVQFRWNSEQAAVTLYRDDVAVALLTRPGRYNDRFRTMASSAVYKLCNDATNQCSEPLTVQF